MVTSLSPAYGDRPWAAPVTINGSGFSGATSVMFGGIAATFKVSSDAAITATAPAAPIGTVNVTVATPLGTSAIVLADEFNYFAPATVTSLSPSTGPVGTSVVITGTNLFATAAVTFGSVAAMSIHVTSNSHVTAVAPAGTGTVDVSVTTPAGTTLTSGSDKFTYAPVVTDVSPESGPATGGTLVTITGTSFSGATAVEFGTVSVVPDSVSDTTVTATSPVGSGTVHVTVMTPAGTSATTPADQFDYVSVVSGVNPNSGPEAGGATVTISGQGFTGATGSSLDRPPPHSR